jgi:prolyl oligopeptidase
MTNPWHYPVTTKIEHKDDYHGTVIDDPYHWLEDDHSPETASWVQAENKATFGYLDKIPYRTAVKDKLLALLDYPRYGQPFRRGNAYFFAKNDGLQKQSVYYVQQGLEGKPQVFLDPNKLSDDGTTALSFLALDKAGKYAAYGTSSGGSDWHDIYVMEVATRKLLPDKLEWAKVTGCSWAGDGFYYSRYDAPLDGHNLSAKNENHKVFFHKVGTSQSSDVLVYEDPANPERFHVGSTSEDERFLYIDISDRGKGKKGNAISYRDLHDPRGKLVPLIPEVGDDSYNVVDEVPSGNALGVDFLVETNHKAPRGRVVRIDPTHPDEVGWREVIPEGPDVLEGVSGAGHKLFGHYLKDVTSRIRVFSFDGKLENEIELPGLGSAGGFSGLREDDSVFYTYTSFNCPATIYRYDLKTRKSTLFRKSELAFEPSNYVVEQVFYTSKDGTRVPMFLVHRKGLEKNGHNPTLLYGYGGFNINLTPTFSPSLIALLDQGFLYCVANLRGGNEYGEKWHEAGMLDNKQHVFDDFIAAAEYLVAEHYTNSGKLAIQGGSNGGLLVGAVMNQRPDLFRVGLAAVGVMDMLRFHKFTIGWNWTPEYGSSDDPRQFKTLLAYSPLHNIKVGARYPSVLVTTADHDDRVVPAHSFKYAAAMQAKVAPTNPVFIRIDTRSGHGASNLIKQIETTADIYSFLMFNLGVPFDEALLPRGTKTNS